MSMKYDELLKLAKEASEKAYVRYSNFPVGACLLTKSGKTYQGCNIENASYGLTVCAERNAIANAIINGETEFEAIAIYAAKMEDCLPCGACRQVILEFGHENDIKIITSTKEGYNVRTINEIIPFGFKL